MKEKRIKLLYLIDELLLGGTEKQLLLLAEELPRERFEPTICVLRKTRYQDTLNLKTPIVNFSWEGIPLVKNISLLCRIHRYLNEARFDIVQTHFVDSTIYGALAVRFCRLKPCLITTRRNNYHWVDEEPWHFRLYRNTVRWTDRIVVNSHRVYDTCQRMEGIPPSKITLIGNAIEVDKFNVVPSEDAKRNFGLAGEFPLIGVVANWRPVKGLLSFLEAAVRVLREIPTARFVLAGNGPQENELRVCASKMGIQDRIVFLGDSPDIPTLLATFDVAVQTSLSESFSNVLLEYMAAARPVVATRVGDAELILENGTAGILVDPGNPDVLASAILALCRDRDRAANMGRQAREKVEANWGVEKTLVLYEHLYEELLREKGRRH